MDDLIPLSDIPKFLTDFCRNYSVDISIDREGNMYLENLDWEGISGEFVLAEGNILKWKD